MLVMQYIQRCRGSGLVNETRDVDGARMFPKEPRQVEINRGLSVAGSSGGGNRVFQDYSLCTVLKF